MPLPPGPGEAHPRRVHHAPALLRQVQAPNDDAKKKGTGDRDNDKDDGFPEVHNAFMIFGGPSACLTTHQRKRERREVISVEVATPQYLDWSQEAITFDQDDHPDYVPNPG